MNGSGKSVQEQSIHINQNQLVNDKSAEMPQDKEG